MVSEGGLTLPEPARTLWRTTRDSVRQGLDAIGHRVEYRLGGTTRRQVRALGALPAVAVSLLCI